MLRRRTPCCLTISLQLGTWREFLSVQSTLLTPSGSVRISWHSFCTFSDSLLSIWCCRQPELLQQVLMCFRTTAYGCCWQIFNAFEPVIWAKQKDQKLASVHVPRKMSWASALRTIRKCAKIGGSRVDTEATACGLKAQVWNLLWTGEEAMKKGMPILEKARFETCVGNDL